MLDGRVDAALQLSGDLQRVFHARLYVFGATPDLIGQMPETRLGPAQARCFNAPQCGRYPKGQHNPVKSGEALLNPGDGMG
jgi:hypothetical protein